MITSVITPDVRVRSAGLLPIRADFSDPAAGAVRIEDTVQQENQGAQSDLLGPFTVSTQVHRERTVRCSEGAGDWTAGANLSLSPDSSAANRLTSDPPLGVRVGCVRPPALTGGHAVHTSSPGGATVELPLGCDAGGICVTGIPAGDVTASCDPERGALFAPGTTSVSCTVTTTRGASLLVDFPVEVVVDPPPTADTANGDGGQPGPPPSTGTGGEQAPSPSPDPPAPEPPGSTCPTGPVVVTAENAPGAAIARYVCGMGLVGTVWQGTPVLMLLPAGYFTCPDPPGRRWHTPGIEFGGFLLQAQCRYRPVMARSWFGPWFAWDPPD